MMMKPFFLLALLSSIFIAVIFVNAQQQQSSPISGVCNGDEAYWIPDGRDYRGKVSVTRSGIPCQAWSSQSPHRHATLIDGSIGIGAHNYCRNPTPDSMSVPWCYTTSSAVLFEQCNVGLPCTEGTESKVTKSAVFSPSPITPDDKAKEIISPAVISLSSETFNASIYYSFDNNVAPSVSSSKLYDNNKKIVIVGSGFVTIRAFAVRPGFQPSPITSATYNILPPSLPKVEIFPDPSQVDRTRPVLVSLSIDNSNDNNNNEYSSKDGLELRYRIVESPLKDETTIITQENSNLYTKNTPFWVRSTATVIAASFIPKPSDNVIQAPTTNNNNNNNQQQQQTAAPSPMSRQFFNLDIPKADLPVIAPAPSSSSSSPESTIEGFGRVVFILSAPKIQQPTFEVCLNFSSFYDGSAESRCRDLRTAAAGATDNAFHLMTLGRTNVAFRVYGPSSAPSDFVNITTIVRPMPSVRLSIPSVATFVGPVDVSATCALSTFKFFVNGEIRIPPVVLDKQGTYNIEAYSETVFDKGPRSTSVVTIEASNLPKPILSPLPEVDVPASSTGGPFVFASPLQVKLRPLSYLGGHAHFKIDVFSVDTQTGSRTRIPEQSFDRAPSNVTTTLTFTSSSSSSNTISTFVVVATTKCNPSAGQDDCSLVDESTTSEVVYNVENSVGGGVGAFLSTPTFLVRRLDGVSASEITEQKILQALFTKSTSTGVSVSLTNSGSDVFFKLSNLSPRLAVEYTNWLAQDLSAASRTARSASLRLRLGFESSLAVSPQVQVSSTTNYIGCLSSTALSSSVATTHFAKELLSVESCTNFCLDKFSSSSSIVAVLSPPNRCDCVDSSSFGFTSSSSASTSASVVMSNANFVSSDNQQALCNNECYGKTCGGTVADPAKYNLWSSTVCSAYLATSSSVTRAYPIASSWQLVQADGSEYPSSSSSKKYSSTTTSVMTLKFTFENLAAMDISNTNNNEGRVVLVKKTPTSNCASDAAALLFTNSKEYASSTNSYNEQLLLGYASTFSYSSGLTNQDMVVPTVGDYRVCVSFPQSSFFGDNKTFVEVTNNNNNNDAVDFLRVIQGQYYPVYVSPKPGSYYSKSSMTINVSTPTAGAYLKISVDTPENGNGNQDSTTTTTTTTKTYEQSWVLITISGPGKHSIIATAVSSTGSASFHGSPIKAEYILVPQPTINVDVAASYLASARYSFMTTSVGSIRVSLSQYGTVRVGSCDDCRIQLLPAGSKCSSLNSGDYFSSGDQQQSSLGPYASGTFSRSSSNNNDQSNDDENQQSLSYISSEMMISAPITQDPIVVCVGGPPWYRIMPSASAETNPRQLLSVASAGIGFCQSADRDKMCQQNGGLCTHVSFSGADEYGCFCPDQATKKWTTFFCSNNSKLPTIWNGSIFDVNSYDGGSSSSGNGSDGEMQKHGSWGAFWTLVLIYVVSLGALWYHKTYRSAAPTTNNKKNSSSDESEMKNHQATATIDTRGEKPAVVNVEDE